jgi:hypothetical protein
MDFYARNTAAAATRDKNVASTAAALLELALVEDERFEFPGDFVFADFLEGFAFSVQPSPFADFWLLDPFVAASFGDFRFFWRFSGFGNFTRFGVLLVSCGRITRVWRHRWSIGW